MSNADFVKSRNNAKCAIISAGLPDSHAEIVADCLVTADEYGVTSHGTSILPSHIDRIFYSEDGSSMNVGFYLTVIDPIAVLGEEYNDIIKEYVNRIKISHPAEGKQITLPGEDRISYRKSR